MWTPWSRHVSQQPQPSKQYCELAQGAVACPVAANRDRIAQEYMEHKERVAEKLRAAHDRLAQLSNQEEAIAELYCENDELGAQLQNERLVHQRLAAQYNQVRQQHDTLLQDYFRLVTNYAHVRRSRSSLRGHVHRLRRLLDKAKQLSQ